MLRIGIIGLPQSGKKTLFQLLTQSALRPDTDFGSPLAGVALMKDSRLDFLVSVYQPKKFQAARIDIVLLPKIEKEALRQGNIFDDLAKVDALVFVARAFANEAVYHESGSVNAGRDIKRVNDELIMHDLLFIEKRLERLRLSSSKGSPQSSAKETQLLLGLKAQLEKELPLRLLNLAGSDLALLSSYPFLTLKEFIILLNISEGDLKEQALLKQLQADFATQKIYFILSCLKAEAEIEALESESERKEFLTALGIDTMALEALSLACLKALGLISFFTVGPQEARQWTLKAGSSAVGAAGEIHSDLARGFIRAEVIKYADLESLGSEEKVKNAGKLYVKGKEYIIEDGDILFIRFSV
jgi:GTP-binding protein YchF